MRESVLRDFPDADISVSIIWIQMPGFNDNESTAKLIAATFDDPRVKHFYDPWPAHRAGKAFAEGTVTRGPAWDIYFFYRKGLSWEKTPPQPTEWMHQLSGGGRADPERFHAGEDLLTHLHQAMHAVTGQDCVER